MKINKNSNSYIIIYATVMVVLVAALLSITALSLKSRQDENVVIEKKGDILRSIGLGSGAAEAANKAQYINQEYAKYITDSYAVNTKGDTLAGADAFSILVNLKAEYDKPAAERQLPIFVSNDNESIHYIIPVWGVGLWGPVWGYIALNSDWNTIYGVVFDHKSETPGLGAEIATPPFQDQFKDKEIFDGTTLVGITVLKGSGSSAGNPSAVDAISGGTITSRAVEKMIRACLENYTAYLDKERARIQEETRQPEEMLLPSDSTTLNEQSHE